MALKIKALSKSFGEKMIFDNFSLNLPDTGAFALVGESGIGKTTLLRMISGLDSNFSGDISGGGIKNTSFAFQEYRLFPTLSALDNIIFANYDKRTAENEKEAKDILKSIGFDNNDMFLFPAELSGGMKQRVSIARAIIRNAPILLLDEPTKELDEENAKKVLDILKRETSSRLVIIVTHRQNDILYLDAEKVKL